MSDSKFRELKAWQLGMDLAQSAYLLTDSFPKVETYGLTSQIRRAAVSIPSNLAEGCGRDSTKEFLHFIAISIGIYLRTRNPNITIPEASVCHQR